MFGFLHIKKSNCFLSISKLAFDLIILNKFQIRVIKLLLLKILFQYQSVMSLVQESDFFLQILKVK